MSQLSVSRPFAGPAGIPSDQAVAGTAVALVGAGLVVALFGVASGSVAATLIGAGAACVGALVLLVGQWVDGLSLLMLSLPMPALLSNEDAHVPICAVLSGLIVAAWSVQRLVEREALRLGHLPVRLISLFLATVVGTAFSAIDPISAVREVVNLGIMVLLLVIATDQFSRYPGGVGRVARTVAAGAGVAGCAALLETFRVIPGDFPLQGTTLNRATVGFGWPNESGMYFSVALPMCVYAYQSAVGRAGRVLGAASIVGCSIGLMCTFSRASWLAVALAPLALTFTGAGRSAARTWLWGALGVVVFDFLSGGALSQCFVSLYGDWVVEQRAALMLVGVLMFLDHPLVGVGPGGFPKGLEQYGPQVANLWDYVGSAHNGYIEIAAQTGIVGLIAFVLMMAAILRRTLRQARTTGSRDPDAGEDSTLRRAAAWSFTTICLVTFTIWPLSHGLGQLLVIVAAMGVARPEASATRA